MGILYLLCVALMFSFGGGLARQLKPYFDTTWISFMRMVFGVFFLAMLKLLSGGTKRGKPVFDKRWLVWIAFGGIAKLIAYLTENYGLTHGVSYGNILVQPVQTVFLTCLSTLVMRERLTRRQLMFMVPCITGVLLVSWNGRPLKDIIGDDLLVPALYVVTGITAGCHVFSQKKLAGRMDIIDSNMAMFALAAVIAAPVAFSVQPPAEIRWSEITMTVALSAVAFGFITGIGFYLNAKAIPLVKFFMVPVIQNTMVIFSILWGVLLFGEPVSVWIIGGSVMFIGGVIGLQLTGTKQKE